MTDSWNFSASSVPLEINNGSTYWKRGSKLHREDGPAIITTSGAERYYRDGILHREDGPAITTPRGHKEWWVNGERKFLVMVSPNEIFIQGEFDMSLYPSLHETSPSTYYIDSDDATLLRLRHNVYESPI